jgi:phosphocarrier protein HPr
MPESKDIAIINKLGLHARAAAKLVHTASRYASDIKLRRGAEEVDAKSILGILLLAAGKGTTVTITASGDDEADAVQSIEQLFLNRFDEVE